MLFPENTAQVQEIIREARESGKGLVPLSSEPPHFHGASENANAETVCFSSMNRIMKIDRRSRYVRKIGYANRRGTCNDSVRSFDCANFTDPRPGGHVHSD